MLEAVAPDASRHVIAVDRLGVETASMLQDAIERGEWVAIAADRTPNDALTRGDRSVTADFLGREAPFPAGPFILASLLKCGVVTLFAVREGNRILIKCEPFADEVKLPSAAARPNFRAWPLSGRRGLRPRRSSIPPNGSTSTTSGMRRIAGDPLYQEIRRLLHCGTGPHLHLVQDRRRRRDAGRCKARGAREASQRLHFALRPTSRRSAPLGAAGRTLTSTGTLSLTGDGAFSWVQKTPFVQTVSLKDGVFTIRYEDEAPEVMKAETHPAVLSAARLLTSVMRLDAAALRTPSTSRSWAAKKPADAWTITLRARDEALGRILGTVTLKGSEYVESIRMSPSNDNVTGHDSLQREDRERGLNSISSKRRGFSSFKLSNLLSRFGTTLRRSARWKSRLKRFPSVQSARPAQRNGTERRGTDQTRLDRPEEKRP